MTEPDENELAARHWRERAGQLAEENDRLKAVDEMTAYLRSSGATLTIAAGQHEYVDNAILATLDLPAVVGAGETIDQAMANALARAKHD